MQVVHLGYLELYMFAYLALVSTSRKYCKKVIINRFLNNYRLYVISETYKFEKKTILWENNVT